MGSRNTRWVALVATLAIVLYLCWLMIQPFVDVLLWSTVLAIVSYPAYLKLRGRGCSAHLSAMLTTVLVVLVVMIPLTFVTAAVVRQAAGAVESVRRGVIEVFDAGTSAAERLSHGESDEEVMTGHDGGAGGRLLDTVGQYVDVGPLRDPKSLAGSIGTVSGAIATRTLGILGGIAGAAVQIFFVLFTLYYLLRDADRIVPAVQASLPLRPEQARGVFARTHEVITASINGVLVISGIQGLLGMFAFWVLGLPSPVLWGVVMFVFSTIPMAGAFVVWVPAAIFLAATGHWGKAAFLTAWGGVVIGLIDNVLRPKLVGERARLHELIIFFSVLGGLQVFGILGLFVGPVVAAIALALVEVFRQANRADDAREDAQSGVMVERPDEMAVAPLATPGDSAMIGSPLLAGPIVAADPNGVPCSDPPRPV